MSKIKSIEIHGFKSEENNIFINFNKNISVVYGENGSGKTTLLKIMHAIFAKDMSILEEENVRKVQVIFEDNEQLKRVIIIKREMDGSYSWNDSLNINISSILFGVNRGISVNFKSIDERVIDDFTNRFFYKKPKPFEDKKETFFFAKELTEYINHYMKYRNRHFLKTNLRISLGENNLIADNVNMSLVEELLVERFNIAEKLISERVQKALFDTLSLAINPKLNENIKFRINSLDMPEDLPKLIYKNKDRLIEVLSNIAENNLGKEIITVLKKLDNEKNIYNLMQNDLLCNLLYKMIKELKVDQEILESINMLVDIFNEQIRHNKKLVINQNGAYIKLSNGKTHTLNELSSGERHLLTFLTIFVIEGSTRDILMIDEPEISLNIKWQRKLVELFRILAPKAQIIVASHSPAISKDSLELVKLHPNIHEGEEDY